MHAVRSWGAAALAAQVLPATCSSLATGGPAPPAPPPPPCPADPYCASDRKEHFQWFYFRVSNTAHETLNVRITNAGRASYPEAWPGYNVCASYDK